MWWGVWTFSQNVSSLALTVWEKQCLKIFPQRISDLMNESIKRSCLNELQEHYCVNIKLISLDFHISDPDIMVPKEPWHLYFSWQFKSLYVLYISEFVAILNLQYCHPFVATSFVFVGVEKKEKILSIGLPNIFYFFSWHLMFSSNCVALGKQMIDSQSELG